MSTLTWEDIVDNPDLVGRDVVIREDGVELRGPIKSIKDEGGMIYLELDWTARQVAGEWVIFREEPYAVCIDRDWAGVNGSFEGHVFFGHSFLWRADLLPPGTSPLEKPQAVATHR